MSAPTETIRELTKFDRCDRCQAAAKVELRFKSGLELMFCGHCFDHHSSKLIMSGAIVIGKAAEEE